MIFSNSVDRGKAQILSSYHRQRQTQDHNICDEVGDDKRIGNVGRCSTILYDILKGTPVGREMCSTGKYGTDEASNGP